MLSTFIISFMAFGFTTLIIKTQSLSHLTYHLSNFCFIICTFKYLSTYYFMYHERERIQANFILDRESFLPALLAKSLPFSHWIHSFLKFP